MDVQSVLCYVHQQIARYMEALYWECLLRVPTIEVCYVIACPQCSLSC